MKTTAFFKKDWFLGLVTVLAVLVLHQATPVFDHLQNWVYDRGVSSSERPVSDRIAFIAIDDASLQSLGRWPWPRELQAQFIDKLASANPKSIAYTVLFTEPEADAGLGYINKLAQLYGSAKAQGLTSAPQLEQMGTVLTEAQSKLNQDQRLAAAIKAAGNVQLGMALKLGEPRGNPDKTLPAFARKATLAAIPGFLPTETASLPIPALGEVAAGTGHLTAINDPADGSVRRAVLFLNYYDVTFPSMALTTTAAALNIPLSNMQFAADQFKLGSLAIPADGQSMVRPHFYNSPQGKAPFSSDSFVDVFTGRVPVGKFAGKIVVVGPTAGGLSTPFNTPIGLMSPGEYQVHLISSMLQGHLYTEPGWAKWAAVAAVLLIAAYLMVLLPRLSSVLGASATAAIVIVLLGAQWFLLTGGMKVLPLVYPAALALIGHLVLTTKRFFVTEQGKAKSDTESAESNRMLGLAFQSQGQLDMAFDKFRRVPMDNAVMENMYNLALDFERKRQFNKAQSVYEFMAGHDPKFKDLDARRNRAKTMSETMILGGNNVRTNTSMLTGLAGVENPMLGRYEIERELGKGAMGVVYQGKDPKIGRVVAIKTVALSQEFEADELQAVRERFFREAETAGRLNHPNIVTIFDAGEEHDLAYIAMEFLKGKDLVSNTKADALLSMGRVASIAARVADALAYAHKNGVVHRDVKPANIMYEYQSDTVKVTDFGIARITDSSKTKTGMVLGTPSYMSPEQLSGMKIDGRSDIFSLGVSLYQLLTGTLPFTGESMAQLMFKIANEPTPDPRGVNPAIPPVLVAIVQKATAKDMSVRYQTAEAMAADLRAALAGAAASRSGATAQATPPASPAAAMPAAAPANAGNAASPAPGADTTDQRAYEKTVVYKRPDHGAKMGPNVGPNSGTQNGKNNTET